VEEPASQAKGRTMSGGITVPVPMEGGSVGLREGRLGIVLVEPVRRGEKMSVVPLASSASRARWAGPSGMCSRALLSEAMCCTRVTPC